MKFSLRARTQTAEKALPCAPFSVRGVAAQKAAEKRQRRRTGGRLMHLTSYNRRTEVEAAMAVIIGQLVGWEYSMVHDIR